MVNGSGPAHTLPTPSVEGCEKGASQGNPRSSIAPIGA